jgi:hypothetical protein
MLNLNVGHQALWVSMQSDAESDPVVNWSWESERVMESIE